MLLIGDMTWDGPSATPLVIYHLINRNGDDMLTIGDISKLKSFLLYKN